MQQWSQNDEAICTHLGDADNQFLGAVVPPIFMNSLHVFDTLEDMWRFNRDEPGQYTYGRVSNPTVALAERKIAALERAEAALCFSSGMAALTSAMMTFLEAGAHVIAIRNLYGDTRRFLLDYAPRFGIEHTFVKGESVEEIERAIRPNTKLIYIESPSSMAFTLQDIRAVADLAKAKGTRTMIDNSWCTPLYQKPLEMGIDLSCHTMSKYIGGHSDIIGGCIAGSKEHIDRIAQNERALFGSILGPMEGALVIRGIRTLPVRMPRHQQSALEVAAFLQEQSYVRSVAHPGLPSHPQYELGQKQMTGTSGVFGVEMAMTPAQTVAFVNALKYFQIGCSWGGYESLALCTMIHASEEDIALYGVPRTSVRLVVGLENTQDLMHDIDQAAAKALRGV